MRGRFLVLEGVDGSGKSTQAERLVRRLEAEGRRPLHLREPGGTPVGERLRAMLLDAERRRWDPRTEALLFFASRAEMLVRRVRPALREGRDVVCERFTPSTLAYQGQDPETEGFVLALDDLVVGRDGQPDLVIILDLDPEVSLERTRSRAWYGDTETSFERRDAAYYRRVRQGYLAYARARAERTFLLPVGGLDADQVEARIAERLRALDAAPPASRREGSP